MIKIFIISLTLLFLNFFGFSQGVIVRAPATQTVEDMRLMAGLNLFVPIFNDSVAANLQKGVDSTGALFYDRSINGFRVRKCCPKRWDYITDSTLFASINALKDTNINIRIALVDSSSSLRELIVSKGNGTVDSVYTGFGLLGGAITNVGTINVDTSKVTTLSYVNSQGFLKSNLPITISASGNVSGISTSSATNPLITLTLATVNNSPGTYGDSTKTLIATVNQKGLIFSLTSKPILISQSQISNPNITGLVSAGAGIAISGSGIQADPYIVNSLGYDTSLLVTTNALNDSLLNYLKAPVANSNLQHSSIFVTPLNGITVGSGGVFTLGNTVTIGIDTTSKIATQYYVLAHGGGGTATTKNDTLVAYVAVNGNNGTAVVGDKNKPFLTIDGALIATSPSAVVIKIGVGEFNSPTSTNIRSNVSFLGSGQPDVNNFTTTPSHDGAITNSSPTKLIGGTILHNSFLLPWNVNFVIIKDLGVDVGLDWCNNFNGGTATDALLIAQQYQGVVASGGTLAADGIHRLQDTLRIGINVENVTCLCKSSSDLVHCALFENCYENHVTNLKTYFGFAGCVIKTISGVYANISSNGHATYGIVFKDNDYSRCQSNTLNGFVIRSIGSFDGMGLSFSSGVDAGSGSVAFCTVSNGSIYGTTYGIHTDGNPAQAVTEGCNIDNIVIFGTQHEGVLANWTYCKLANSLVWNSATNGYDVTNTYGASNTVANCQALACGGDGFHLTCTSSTSYISFSNIVATDNTGVSLVVSGNVSGIGLISSNNVGGNDITGNLIPIGVNTATPTGMLDVNGDGTNDPFRIRNIKTATDTTNYKPICIDIFGNQRKLGYWPAAGGASGTDTTINAGYGIIKTTAAKINTYKVDTLAIEPIVKAQRDSITLANKIRTDSTSLQGGINTNTTAIAGKQNTVSLTTTGSSGVSTFNPSTGALNIPNYVTPQGNLTGDVTSSGLATTYNNVVPANKGGAGTVTGILQANGSGVVSQAVSGTDYAAPLNGTGLVSQLGATTSYNTTSASIAAILTDETGTGSIVFGTAPTLTGSIFAAGTTTVAPINLTSGTDKTTPVAGNLEFNGTRLAFSPSTTRKRITLTNDVTPANGQIPIGNATDFTIANITGTTGIVVTNGAGTIAITSDTSTTTPFVLRSGTKALTNNWNAGAFTISNTFPAAAANTVFDSYILNNTTSASTGNQMYSPATEYIGQGWKTTATAASQPVNIRNYLVPVQGTTNPTMLFNWDAAVNGGSYTTMMQFYTSGVTTGNAGLNIFSSALAGYMITAGGSIGGLDANGSTGLMRFGGISGGYFPTFLAGGTEVMRLNSNLNVLIGTTANTTTAKFVIASTTQGTITDPVMTNAQRTAISSPAIGLHVYQSDGLEGGYTNTSFGWAQNPNLLIATATLDFPSTGGGASSDLTITLTGAIVGDVVALGSAVPAANSMFSVFVSATNTVTVRYLNIGVTPIDPASATYKVSIIR